MFNNNKTFSIVGLHVDYLHDNGGKNANANSLKKEKETERLFHELEELIRRSKMSGGSFDYDKLNGVEMDLAFMAISRQGIWLSTKPGGIRSEGVKLSALSFAHVQVGDVRVFFVENPYKGKVYVIFSLKNEIRIAIISSWDEDFDFNTRNTVSKFYWNHYDDSDKTLIELIKWLERKPWNMLVTAGKKKGGKGI